MRTVAFIGITLLAGVIAGTTLAALNQIIVQPYIEQAITFENEGASAEAR
jgi:predicted cobalt transporter CbtA